MKKHLARLVVGFFAPLGVTIVLNCLGRAALWLSGARQPHGADNVAVTVFGVIVLIAVVCSGQLAYMLGEALLGKVEE